MSTLNNPVYRARAWGVLLALLASGPVAACTSLSGNDFYSRDITVRNELAPGIVLQSWLGNSYGAASYSGCAHSQAVAIRFTPSLTGLSFVRNVTVNGVSYPAFGWSSTSPLVIFQYWNTISGAPQVLTPLDMRNARSINGRSGNTNNLQTALQFAVVSRGGAMTSVAKRVHATASTQLTAFPRAGTLAHSLTFGITVPSVACTLSDASLTLSDVRPTDLPADGRTAGNRTLSVNMNCPGAGTPVKLTLTDATGSSGAAGQLMPSAGSTARGVRIRLLRSGTPVTFGSQWDHGSSSAGNQNINFTAQYIRTGALTAGSIGGRATLTAEYR